MDSQLHSIIQKTMLLILIGMITYSTAIAAPIQVLNTARKDLPARIESTNLNAQNYVWQLELSPQSNQQIQVKLLNPHAQLSVLNTRALNIARQIKLSQIPKIDSLSGKSNLNTDEKNLLKTNFYYGKYILIIKFPRGFQYSIKPGFKAMNDVLQKLCDSDTRKQKGFKIQPDQKHQLIFNANLSVDSEGQIHSVKYNPTLDQETVNLLSAQFKKARFYPYNQYGIPMPFSVDQPLIIQCNTQ